MLSQQQINQFFDQGFLIFEDMFSHAEIKEMLHYFDHLQNMALLCKETTTTAAGTNFVMTGPRIDRIVWCAGECPELLEISQDPRILAPVSELLGSTEVVQLICQAHYKLPGDNLSFQWHQDSNNREEGTSLWTDINGKGSFVQTAIAIDQMTENNGPIMFVPGSSKQGHIDLIQHPERFNSETAKIVTPLLNPGTAIMFHPWVIHGSTANQSEKPRRVFINGYAYPGANRKTYPGCGTGRTTIYEGE